MDEQLVAGKALGIEPEKAPYKPHLTLARASMRSSGNPHQRLSGGTHVFQRLQDKLAAIAAPDFGTMTAREFFLYQSKLSPQGAQYTKIAKFALNT